MGSPPARTRAGVEPETKPGGRAPRSALRCVALTSRLSDAVQPTTPPPPPYRARTDGRGESSRPRRPRLHMTPDTAARAASSHSRGRWDPSSVVASLYRPGRGERGCRCGGKLEYIGTVCGCYVTGELRSKQRSTAGFGFCDVLLFVAAMLTFFSVSVKLTYI